MDKKWRNELMNLSKKNRGTRSKFDKQELFKGGKRGDAGTHTNLENLVEEPLLGEKKDCTGSQAPGRKCFREGGFLK